mmetsp:Transcript_88312/g.263384  ORF Transcript_88312/g.263384 Transcript_88312/m.263384 type:complete len:285 (+) Transcript_88312:1371-2225(+)
MQLLALRQLCPRQPHLLCVLQGQLQATDVLGIHRLAELEPHGLLGPLLLQNVARPREPRGRVVAHVAAAAERLEEVLGHTDGALELRYVLHKCSIDHTQNHAALRDFGLRDLRSPGLPHGVLKIGEVARIRGVLHVEDSLRLRAFRAQDPLGLRVLGKSLQQRRGVVSGERLGQGGARDVGLHVEDFLAELRDLRTVWDLGHLLTLLLGQASLDDRAQTRHLTVRGLALQERLLQLPEVAVRNSLPEPLAGGVPEGRHEGPARLQKLLQLHASPLCIFQGRRQG